MIPFIIYLHVFIFSSDPFIESLKPTEAIGTRMREIHSSWRTKTNEQKTCNGAVGLWRRHLRRLSAVNDLIETQLSNPSFKLFSSHLWLDQFRPDSIDSPFLFCSFSSALNYIKKKTGRVHWNIQSLSKLRPFWIHSLENKKESSSVHRQVKSRCHHQND